MTERLKVHAKGHKEVVITGLGDCVGACSIVGSENL
jgi:chemotaxis receptor (MCP) glutamine deamidase CheD